MIAEIVSITIDNATKEKLDQYARAHSISRSATIRLLLNEFFDKGLRL
jgi:predicted transcriptional regulator